MRNRDEKKFNKIIKAAVTLINKDGFASTAMSNIAKVAGVSPATIYIYFKNKKDMLVKTYLNVKKEIAVNMLSGVDLDQPVEKAYRTMWFNFYNSITKNTDYFIFAEQFENSPIIDSVNSKEIDAYYEPMLALL